jgi:hypothetical protein
MNRDNTWNPLLAFDKNGKQTPIPQAGKSDSVQGTTRPPGFASPLTDETNPENQVTRDQEQQNQNSWSDIADTSISGVSEAGDGPAGSASEETHSPGADPVSGVIEAGGGQNGSASEETHSPGADPVSGVIESGSGSDN